MKSKRIVSILLALLLTASCVCSTAFAADDATSYNEYKKMLEATTAENNYGLEDTVNEGKILQAWNWSYNNVIANLETVAKQGFTTIQVSPPNELKMPTKGVKVCEPAVDGIAPNGWWMFYQPAGFQLNESTDNALGVKSEFVKMCEEAHKIGVKIIVDAVINHFGTDDDHVGVYDNTSTDPMTHVNPRAWEFEPEILNAKAIHDPWVNMTYKENYWDGWSDRDIEEDLTQHCTSGLPDLATETQLVQDAIYDYFVELVEAGADGFRFDAAKHIETKHDTYFASDFWEDTLLKLRANYPDKELYAYGEILNKCGDGRPFKEYTELMDVTDSSSYWGIKDAVVYGTGNSIPSYPSYEDANTYGANVEKFNPENVIQWNESHDTYIDGGTSALTVEQRDKIWALTAARQTITGIYFARPDDATGADRAAIEKICANITLGDANVTSWANPAVKAVNQFDNYFGDAEEALSVNNKKTLIERGGLGATIVNLSGTTDDISTLAYTLAEGKYTDAITGNTFRVTDGTLTGTIGSTGIAVIYYAQDTEPVFPEKPDAEKGYPVKDGYTTVVFTDSQNWGSVSVYAWSNTQGEAAAWPGVKMMTGLTNDMGQQQYYAFVPEYCDNIIFNNNGVQSVDTTFSGHTAFYADSQGTDGKWTLGTFDVKFNIYNPLDDYALGDVNMDGYVNIADVTKIQKSLINLDTLNKSQKILADYNASGTLNIKDATAIQYKLIGLE